MQIGKNKNLNLSKWGIMVTWTMIVTMVMDSSQLIQVLLLNYINGYTN